MSQQQLTDITRGMHYAASTTAAMVAQQYLRLIDAFFEKNGKDTPLIPKMVRIKIDDAHVMDVPLITLLTPKGLTLDNMEVQMSVRIDQAVAKKAMDATRFASSQDSSNATRTSFTVEMAPKTGILGRRSDITDIKMTFKAGDPPEGMMRVIEEYTNLIKIKAQ